MSRLPQKLYLSHTLMLPRDAVTQRFGVLGTIGSGKTYAATKLAECMLDTGAQIVAIDPVGVWWGLRAKGRGPGYPVTVFGGLHGDLPLEINSGALIADIIVDRGISAVIDLSQIEYDTDRAKWCSDFGRRFFFRKQQKRSAVHVFIEEAQEILPEEPQAGEQRMLHTFVRMAKLGRNFGIGLTLVTQRPQDVSKKALNLTECIMAFRVVGTHERAAIKRWIDYKGAPEGLLDTLPKLATGNCRIVSREWLKVDTEIRVAEKRSADVSQTPKPGARKITTRDLTPVDIAALRERMAEAIERQKAEDPTELRKELAKQRNEVQRLTREIERAKNQKPVAAPRPPKVVTIGEQNVKRLEKFGSIMREAINKANEAIADLGKLLRQQSQLPVMYGRQFVGGQSTPHVEVQSMPDRSPLLTGTPTPITNGSEPSKLGKGERNIAIAIAQQHAGATAEQITVLTGYKQTSRNEYVRRLIGAGYVVKQADRYCITSEGLSAVGTFEQLPTGAALVDYWRNRLPSGEAKIFEAILNGATTKEEISANSDYKATSVNEYLRRLKARELVTERDGRHVVSDALS